MAEQNGKNQEVTDAYDAVNNLEPYSGEIFRASQTIKATKRWVKKSLNIVLLGQSILFHSFGMSMLPTAKDCSNSEWWDSAGEITEEQNSSNESNNTEERLKKLIEQFPDIAKAPKIEQEALLRMYEKDRREVKKRVKHLKQNTNPQEIQAFKDELKEAITQGEDPSFEEFFKQHERTVLNVDEKTIASGSAHLEKKAGEINKAKQQLGTLQTLEKIAKITETPADTNPDIEQDMVSVSVYKYLYSIQDPNTKKVIGSCQAKGKAAAMLLEKVFPEYKDKIFTMNEAFHTYTAIEIDGSLFAINNGKAYRMEQTDRYGRKMYSPHRSIRGYAGMAIPKSKACTITKGEKCHLSVADSREGEAITITIPKDVKRGISLPGITENDGIGYIETESKLLSIMENIKDLYPNLDKERRKIMLEKIAEAKSPDFYSSKEKTHYLNIGEHAGNWGEDIVKETQKVLTENKSGQLTLDFGNAKEYQAETLHKILNSNPDIQRDNIFDGISTNLLKAIAHSKINGDMVIAFRDKKTLEESKDNILKLLQLPNAPEFNIRFAFYKGVNPDEQFIQEILTRLEENPVKVSIVSTQKIKLSEETKKRIKNIVKNSEMQLWSHEGSEQNDNPQESTTYRIVSPNFEIKSASYADDWSMVGEINRLDGHIVPHLTKEKAEDFIKNEKTDTLIVRYRVADIEALRILANWNQERLILDTDYLSASEARVLATCNAKKIYLEGISHLDAETAKALSTFKGDGMNLDGLTQLDEATAKAMSTFKGEWINLDGLTQLDAETAKALSTFKVIFIYLNGIKQVDAATAKALSTFTVAWLNLGGINQMDAATAKALSDFKGRYIILEGISHLDAETAKALSTFKGRGIDLSGIKQMDEGTAKALSAFKGRGIILNGIKQMDEGTAKALSTLKGEEISLGGIRQLDIETAKALSTFKGKKIFLDGLEQMDKETAKALSAFKGDWISLDGLTQLDAETAKLLLNFSGQMLRLNDIKQMDEETAKALSAFKGAAIYLHGLTQLDEGTAKALSTFKGTGLGLNGVTQLDAETAKALSTFKGTALGLSGLTQLDAETAKALSTFSVERLGLNDLNQMDEETAKALSAFKGKYIYLDGLRQLDEGTAKALSTFKGKKISLNGLSQLNEGTAKALSTFKGDWISLDGLSQLDAETAKALSTFKGKLIRFNGLKQMESGTAKALSIFSGVEIGLNGLTQMDEGTAEALSTFKGDWISLDGLTQMDEGTAKALSTFKGRGIRLDGLKQMDEGTAKALSTFKGDWIRLRVLTQLTPQKLKILSSFNGNLFPKSLQEQVEKYKESN